MMQIGEAPQIYIYYEKGMGETAIQAVFYGLEEEGIPYRAVEKDEHSAIDLAYQAAVTSPLAVGIGCTTDQLVLHYNNLAKEQPYQSLTRFQTLPVQQVKRFGGNAARLVKGIPFNEIK